MALAGPPRNHENGAAAKAIFTPVPRRFILRTSPLRSLLWALLERALRREAADTAGGSGTFREQMLRSRQMPCLQAEAAGRGVPKRSLTARRAPGAPPPQEDDPGRCEAQLDPLDALPAFLPARVVPDFGVEPDAWTCGLEHPFVGGVVLRVVQRRAASAAVDGVARAKRLHRRHLKPSLDSAGSLQARQVRLWLRRPQRRRTRPCGDRPPSRPS